MPEITSTHTALETVRTVRQVRAYTEGAVSDDQVNTLLEIARWTGSAKNTQPWHFVVVRAKDTLHKLSRLRENIHWVEDGALCIALVSSGEDVAHTAYDEGRVTERIMIAARMLGLGAGTAWFGGSEGEAKAREILGVPDDRALRSVVVVGQYITHKDPRPAGPKTGRKPLNEIVSYEKFE